MPQFIDRRLNPRDKSLGNRQRFLRRTRAEIKQAVDKAVARAHDRRRRQGRIGLDPDRRHRRAAVPPVAASGGDRERVLPGNKEFVAGDRIEKPKAAAAAARAAARPPDSAAARTRSPSR